MSRKTESGCEPLDRVAVALDTGDWETFCRWADIFGPRVGVLKVGLEAYTRWGPEAVRRAKAAAGGLFLDLKLHDIPNTVAGAVSAAADLGVDYLTVHASGGSVMLEAAEKAAGDRMGLLAVTVLTHLDEGDLEALDLPGSAAGRALAWAKLASEVGCAGVVCSAHECATLRRQLGRPFKIVVPGIRLAPLEAEDDQRRTALPEEALADGADLLVIGRPLTHSDDPESALRRLSEAILGRARGGPG